MEWLYVLRHGVAVPHGTPDLPDDDRPLTDKGRRRMREVARGLKRLGLEPDRIVTSPLPRARQSAEIVAEVLGLEDGPEESDELRAGRDANAIREWLNGRTEGRLMIVGHDPAFSELVGLLVTGRGGAPIVELRKGGVAALRHRPDGGRPMLEWLARPRLLRRPRG